ncbi:hypothetical protein BT67DRAFT_7500 [Trichocladium antarcticum]|uniref:Uncharacterized protein n=1 Tax=Trichocladium antarcticum TaxID=1450529 RepID=A0AAN6UT06_9PEZI|nr:hypothetical protein BT67DRAFT_7500 [Trichocladium antarcticum]
MGMWGRRWYGGVVAHSVAPSKAAASGTSLTKKVKPTDWSWDSATFPFQRPVAERKRRRLIIRVWRETSDFPGIAACCLRMAGWYHPPTWLGR